MLPSAVIESHAREEAKVFEFQVQVLRSLNMLKEYLYSLDLSDISFLCKGCLLERYLSLLEKSIIDLGMPKDVSF